jgi:hypothetical protein
MEGNPAADPEINPDAVARLPVQYLDVHDVKQQKIAHRHARAPLQARTRSKSGFALSFEAVAGHVSLSPGGGGPGPAAGYLALSSPGSGLSCLATHAPTPHHTPRRSNDGAAAVRLAAYERSERMVFLFVQRI